MALSRYRSVKLVAEKVKKVPKALLFQLAAALLATVLIVFMVPIFTSVMRPQREKEQSVQLEKFAGNKYFEQFFLKEGPSASIETKSKVDTNVAMDLEKQQGENRTDLLPGGWLDLAASFKTINPDALNAEVVVTGLPYGRLASQTEPDNVIIKYENDQYIAIYMDCDQQRAESVCAYLSFKFGKSKLVLASGKSVGYSQHRVDLQTDNGWDYYPFDTYTATGTVEASIRFFYSALDDPADGNSSSTHIETNVYPVPVRLHLMPSVSGWSGSSYNLDIIVQNITYVNQTEDGTLSVVSEPFRPIMRYHLNYKRSTFVRFFAVMIVVLMWIMSVYLVVLAVDHVLFRPRALEPDTVGYSVGMLFALPTLRMLLDAPLGSYIDFLGFTWCMLLVAVAVIIFFSGAYSDHDHRAEVFEKHVEPQEVAVSKFSSDTVDQLVKLLHDQKQDHSDSVATVRGPTDVDRNGRRADQVPQPDNDLNVV